MLHSAKRVSLADSVKHQLTRLIVSGVFRPGQQLPPERELCSQMNVGRTSLREAIRALQAMGYVEVHPGKGTYVRPDANQVVPYSAWPSTFQCTAHDVLELRLAIEPRATALAATRSDSSDLESIAASLTAMESALENPDLAALVLADLSFHQSIVQASKNPLFMEVMNKIVQVQIESLRVSLSRPDRPRRVLELHRSIFEAIRRSDSEGAAQAMRDHLLAWANEFQFQSSRT